MRHRLLQHLACPACGDTDLTLETTKTQELPTWHGAWSEDVPGVSTEERRVTDIVEGALHCACGQVYPIREGVPRMLPEGYTGAQSSGHRFSAFDGSLPEYEANFGDMADPLKPADYVGKTVLDAGCGFGRHAFYSARYGAEVIAFDNSDDAVASAQDNTRGLAHVHVVQGDVLRPPFRQDHFDLVYAFGVLHHLAYPLQAFRLLGELVRPGGKLQVWVYGPRAGTAAIVSGALRGAAVQMNDETLHGFSRAIASGLRLFSHTPYRFLGQVPVLRSVLTHLPAHDHHQWPFDVVVADVFDRLRIPVHYYFRGEEIEAFFVDAGFADVHVNRRVRNSESFRGIGTRR
ncbi:MAG: methyltransferase domain-containing protein [Proteobacteria bacterium]|nr:methyltransferase domain-containing protein [Pseudomonadota bacterium]MCP4920342.1 methyltransferase domain-containing protein [Pseudomonadota bacterium]